MIIAITALVGFVVTGAVSWYGIFSTGYVVSMLWLWFAVPRGLPLVTWHEFAAAAIGINIYRAQDFKPEKPNKEQATAIMIGFLIAPWVSLLCGWLLR